MRPLTGDPDVNDRLPIITY